MSETASSEDVDVETFVSAPAEHQPFGALEIKFKMSDLDKDHIVIADWVEEEDCLKDKTVSENSSSSEHSSSSSEDETVKDENTKGISERKRAFKKLISVREKAIHKGILAQNVDQGASCLKCEECPGFELHVWRRVCNNCRCGREDHDITEDIPVEDRLNKISMKDDNDNITDEEKILSNYAWLPPGLDVALVQEYMNSLPKSSIPRFDNADGIKYRNKQLLLQLPLQDASPDNCKFLPENSRYVHDKFRKNKEEAMGTGHVEAAYRTKICRGCTNDIPNGSVYVIAFSLGEDAVWHPSCFTCVTCKELLADLVYFYHDKEEQIYCGRHYGELLKPRCASCDEIIFTGEYVNAAKKSYHMDHFCCIICDRSLNGEAHLIEDNQPLCVQCYNNKFSNMCHKCSKAISVEDKDILYDNHHWHNTCLTCVVCEETLSDKSFMVREEDGGFICTACHKKTDARQCQTCGNGFEPGSKRLELNGLFWHDDCFSCEICENAISSRKFMRHENKVVCVSCYEENFVKKCFGCKKPLTEGGISYNGHPYHRHCFCCHNCQASIASSTFSVRDEQYYCTECFATLFGKKCKGCDSFILTGEYFTLDDNSWHKECFKCVKCGNPLAQSTFVQEGDQIKLMCEACMVE